MDIQSVNISPRVMVLLGLVFASSEIAQAQTVVFKQPPVASQSCAFDTKALLAKILELKNVNAQLANRAMALEGQVAAMKVVSVKKNQNNAILQALETPQVHVARAAITQSFRNFPVRQRPNSR